MTYFADDITKAFAKQLFRKLCVKLHPDKTGGTQTDFVIMQAQYESFLKGTFEYTTKQAKEESNALKDFVNANEFIKAFDGVTVELTGTWVWLCGNTFEYKEQIKAHGFKWSKSKKKWYKAPEGTKTNFKKRGTDFKKIQNKYGYSSMNINNKTKRVA